MRTQGRVTTPGRRRVVTRQLAVAELVLRRAGVSGSVRLDADPRHRSQKVAARRFRGTAVARPATLATILAVGYFLCRPAGEKRTSDITRDDHRSRCAVHSPVEIRRNRERVCRAQSWRPSATLTAPGAVPKKGGRIDAGWGRTMNATHRSWLEPRADVPTSVSRGRHPVRAAGAVTIIGYVVVSATMIGIGLLLTHALESTVGGWDRHVAEFFAHHRSAGLNGVTKRATSGVGSILRVHHASLPAMILATIVVAVLAYRGRWREGAFLAIAFALEFTAYRSIVHVVSRQRPHVFDLDRSPSNTSYPSGHTAAATVLFVGITLVVIWTTRNTVARVATAVVAVAATALVGFARVYRGQHSLLDVVAGVVLGLACLAVAALAVRAASRHAKYAV
jgi:membrane-associated phospholipid phosphatase